MSDLGRDNARITRRRREERTDAVIEVPFNQSRIEVECPVCGAETTVKILLNGSVSFCNCWNSDCDAFLKFEDSTVQVEIEETDQSQLAAFGSESA